VVAGRPVSAEGAIGVAVEQHLDHPHGASRGVGRGLERAGAGDGVEVQCSAAAR